MQDDSGTEKENLPETVDLDAEAGPNPDHPLSPRHRKLAEYLAQGRTNVEISQLLGYSQSRVSILKHSGPIKEEVRRIMDSTLEADVKSRIRSLANPALDVLEETIRDKTNRYSPKEKIDVAKYLADHAAGKSVQKHEVVGGMIVRVMDQLDSLKASGKGLEAIPAARDVTPKPEMPERELTPEEKEEAEAIARWKDGF